MPPGAVAPGLGAPSGPLPPPSILAGAVETGTDDVVELAEVGEAEEPLPALLVGAGVMVTTMADVKVLVCRLDSRTVPTENDVERMGDGEACALWVADAELFCDDPCDA